MAIYLQFSDDSPIFTPLLTNDLRYHVNLTFAFYDKIHYHILDEILRHSDDNPSKE